MQYEVFLKYTRGSFGLCAILVVILVTPVTVADAAFSIRFSAVPAAGAVVTAGVTAVAVGITIAGATAAAVTRLRHPFARRRMRWLPHAQRRGKLPAAATTAAAATAVGRAFPFR